MKCENCGYSYNGTGDWAHVCGPVKVKHYSNTNNPIDFPKSDGMNERFIVICRECSEEHLTTEIEFLNVEEDMHGHDVMYFVCPITKTETESRVYRK